MDELIGKIIEEIQPLRAKEGKLQIKLNNGDALIFGDDMVKGADGGWYTVPTVWLRKIKIENIIIWQGQRIGNGSMSRF